MNLNEKNVEDIRWWIELQREMKVGTENRLRRLLRAYQVAHSAQPERSWLDEAIRREANVLKHFSASITFAESLPGFPEAKHLHVPDSQKR